MELVKQQFADECGVCLGKGYYPAGDGPDDFQMMYCGCDAGERLQDEDWFSYELEAAARRAESEAVPF